MRDDVPEGVLLEAHRVTTTVTSWRGGEQIGDLPVEAGTIDWFSDVAVAGRLELTVPQTYAPRGFTDAVGTYGQRLNVQQTIHAAQGSFTLNLGWFVVAAWQWEYPACDIEGLTLDQLLDEYRLVQPFQASAPTTYLEALEELCEGVLPVSAGVADKAVGVAISQDEDRSLAINDVRKGWGVDVRVDDDGVVAVTPKRTLGTPVRSWQHGQASAFVSLGSSGLRDDVFNMVVARSEKADGTPLQAVATDDNPASPTYYRGPYGRRVRFFAANLATTLAQVQAAADTVLAQEMRRTRLIVVDAPPDPRLEIGDTVSVTDLHGDEHVGLLAAVRLPLVARQGAATYTVEVP